jgi:hypothetical protein
MRRKLVVVALASVLLTGPNASATVIEYSALLFGNQEVPPVATHGGGYVTADIDTSTNTLTWLAQWWNLNAPVSGAHFHGPAPAGVNAPIIQGVDHPINGIREKLHAAGFVIRQQI